jgi:hypothetical protein
MAQLEEETLADNMLANICELDHTPTEVAEDRTNNTPSKEHGSQRVTGNPIESRDSIEPESRSLMDDTRHGTEENAIQPINMPLTERSCSGEPENRLPEDDDARPVTEDNTTYSIDVPLADLFHC